MARKGLIFLLIGLGLGVLLGAVILFNTNSSNKGPKVGNPLDAFQINRLDGKTLRLADLKGKAVLLNFWATWCIPCQDEMPLLEKYAQKYADNLVVIGIDSGEDSGVVSDYVKKLGITFPIALDSSGDLTRSYLINGFPTSLFVDKEGVLRNLHIGALREDLLTGYLRSIEVTP